MGVTTAAPTSIEDIEARLRERKYIGDRALATSIFLALKLEKPLFIEGEAGVGKTEAAKVMADVLGAQQLLSGALLALVERATSEHLAEAILAANVDERLDGLSVR